MPNLLSIENLIKSHGDSRLINDITFGVDEGEKIGIVARNGTGKTTLLRMIAGVDAPDKGRITFSSGLKIAYLPQEPEFIGQTVGEAALNGVDLDKMDQDDRQRYTDRLAKELSRMGLPDLDENIAHLSGGQRKRLALVRVVMAEPDFIILDEPTNHLDITTIEWLENYLKRSRATILMVTHDRYFLDRVCNRIIELDNGKIFSVNGNYDMYLRRRAERIEAMSAELARVKNTLRKEQDWMSRQPQARAGKAKFRIDRFYELKERSQVNLTEKNVQLDTRSSRIGSKIFEAEKVCKRFGEKIILDNFSYIFARGEKVGIVGINGVGKSTFIKMLQGLVPLDSGQWVVGETVRFGYYSQDGIQFDENKKVIDAVNEIAEDIDLGNGTRIAPMQYLQRFLFSPADQQKYIYKLSGGERCRLHLATVLMRQPNFLILDEPTNDLDIITLGILEEYLADFKGCVIVVSHDRYFLDNIVDHLFVMEGNGVVKDFPGNYSDYRQYLQEEAKNCESQSGTKETSKPRRSAQRPQKMTFKERQEFQSLEKELQILGDEKKALEDFFANGGGDDFDKKSQRYNEIQDIIDEKELRWLELSEKE